MSSLINAAMSGLSAAQAALNTVSNNISNYNVAGYTRQNVILSQANSTLNGGAWYGNGVNVTGVHREYNEFITLQLRNAQSQASGLTTQYQQVAGIDDMLASTNNSLSTTLQGFFTSVQNLVSNADDPSARQTLLGKAEGLVNQFKVNDQSLRNMATSVNRDISASVDQINNYAQQIANLNQQIAKLTGIGAGAQPNDLLDQRDQLVNALNQLVGVEVSVQDGSSYNLTIANGISLVQGSRYQTLAAIPSSADPSRTVVAQVDSLAGNQVIPESSLNRGSLGGLLAFRSENLDGARNRLGQLAMAFASSLNAQHRQGFDSEGIAGGDLFTLGQPEVLANAANRGSASLSASWQETSKVAAADYRVSYQNGSWQVKRLSDNAPVSVTPGNNGSSDTLSFDGLTVTLSGAPAEQDSFVVKPVANAIVSMSVAIKDPAKLAAASEPGGASDNRNAQKLLDLQGKDLVNGNSTLTQAYASLVSEIGNKTSTLKTTVTTQSNVVTQLTRQQQSISGVNLDEEYGDLQRYQQYYMANAQVMQAAQSMFDALISIR
ncbi:flagellar hook-associated protein FlgK [Pantoea sp. 1.19]|uniref:flagellar hook-associated protein FlgK n=1 Tax=Pantoea sp. 1.19 TaxID=1925589 RepID=UPI000949185D|nr:flagellar hook-associated protein FlgK [Pantoea sp. 1.19]